MIARQHGRHHEMFSPSSEGFVVVGLVEQCSDDVTQHTNRRPRTAHTANHPVQSSFLFQKSFLHTVYHVNVVQIGGFTKDLMFLTFAHFSHSFSSSSKISSFGVLKRLIVKKTELGTSLVGGDINDGSVNNINSEDGFCRGVLWSFALEIMMPQTHQRARPH